MTTMPGPATTRKRRQLKGTGAAKLNDMRRSLGWNGDTSRSFVAERRSNGKTAGRK
jgi:hypothetical protein